MLAIMVSSICWISRFLHDEVGQVLSAVGLQLDALRHDLGARTPELEQRTSEIQQMLETMIASIRDLSYELNPSVVQRTGLQFALERLAGRFHEAFSGGVRLQLDSIEAILRHSDEFHVMAEAESGYEAVQISRKQRPAIVLMDIALPGLNRL